MSKGKQQPDPVTTASLINQNYLIASGFYAFGSFSPVPLGGLPLNALGSFAEFRAIQGQSDDWYIHSSLPGTIGRVDFTGNAVFYQGMTREELEALEFSPQNPNTAAGGLPSRPAEPPLTPNWACPMTPPGVGDATTVDDALARYKWYGDVSNYVSHDISIEWTSDKDTRITDQTPPN